MYADDCVLYLSRDLFHKDLRTLSIQTKGNNWEIMRKKIQKYLACFEHWGLLDFVKQYNYLGVILDSEMNMRPFFNHVERLFIVNCLPLGK